MKMFSVNMSGIYEIEIIVLGIVVILLRVFFGVICFRDDVKYFI